MTEGGAFGRLVARRPKVAGVALALVLAAAYGLVLRPARVLATDAIARPVLERIDTERARTYEVVDARGQATSLFVVPRQGTVEAREAGRAEWAAPAGVLFILPALFLAFAFPARPYWLYLLGYHLGLGVLALGVFAVGLGWFEPAFALYTFSRTYMTEAVSLAVPLLLWLAGRAADQPSATAAT